MLDASTVFYMDKIVTDAAGIGVVDIRKPIGENLRALAAAKGKERRRAARRGARTGPRHEQLIADIREAGAGTRLISDGDVAGGINAARYESRIDMCVGIGGSPEGITTACAIKALGGFMQGVLAPKDDEERARGEAAGLDCDRVYELDDLVRSDNTFFVATGVTDGELVDGVRKKGPIIRTESIVLRGQSGTIRRVIADHLAEKWLDEADRLTVISRADVRGGTREWTDDRRHSPAARAPAVLVGAVPAARRRARRVAALGGGVAGRGRLAGRRARRLADRPLVRRRRARASDSCSRCSSAGSPPTASRSAAS